MLAISRTWLNIFRSVLPVILALIAFVYSVERRVSHLENGGFTQTDRETFTAILVEIQAIKGTIPKWHAERVDRIEKRVEKLEERRE